MISRMFIILKRKIRILSVQAMTNRILTFLFILPRNYSQINQKFLFVTLRYSTFSKRNTKISKSILKFDKIEKKSFSTRKTNLLECSRIFLKETNLFQSLLLLIVSTP